VPWIGKILLMGHDTRIGYAGRPVSPGALALNADPAHEGWQTVERAASATPEIGANDDGSPLVDLPDPHAGPGQVRIAVRAAGVNPSDWKKRKGLMDRDLPQTVG
jgi:hypothetical protein